MATIQHEVLTFSNEIQDALANLKERRERVPVNLEGTQYYYEDIIFFMLLVREKEQEKVVSKFSPYNPPKNYGINKHGQAYVQEWSGVTWRTYHP